MSAAPITVIPANEASCADLATVFGERGSAARCSCQRYKLARREAFKHHPPSERAARLRSQTRCGDRAAATTSGLVAYADDGEPAGWCAVESRPAFFGMARVARVPWEGRAEDKADASVWAVTCVFARAGYRRRGVAIALAAAAVGFALARGPRAGGLSDARGRPVPDEVGGGVPRRHRAHVRRRGAVARLAARQAASRHAHRLSMTFPRHESDRR